MCNCRIGFLTLFSFFIFFLNFLFKFYLKGDKIFLLDRKTMEDFMKKLAMLVIFFLVAVMIIGCKDPEVPQSESAHEHTFADSWSTSATHHWKAATCEHTSEVSEKAEHTLGEWT